MSKLNKSLRGKLFRYFKGRLKIKLSTKGYYRCNCPYCAGNYCFSVHMNKNEAKCFKCEERHSLIELLMYMEDFQAVNKARDYLKLQQEYEEYDDAGGTPTRRVKTDVNLPQSFTSIINRKGILGRIAYRYMTKKRGFNELDLVINGVGYCLEGKYAGYIIFPCYRKTKLIFFQGRKFVGNGPKMMNPENEEFGVGKTEVIFNEDALLMYTHINVVESITNAITLGESTVAILGKSISDYQLKKIIASPCTHITILLDDDALIKAIDLVLQLVHYKRVRLVRMPNGKDVNDLGRKKTRKLMGQFGYKPYMYYFKLRQKINAISLPAYKRIGPSYSSKRGF